MVNIKHSKLFSRTEEENECIQSIITPCFQHKKCDTDSFCCLAKRPEGEKVFSGFWAVAVHVWEENGSWLNGGSDAADSGVGWSMLGLPDRFSSTSHLRANWGSHCLRRVMLSFCFLYRPGKHSTNAFWGLLCSWGKNRERHLQKAFCTYNRSYIIHIDM